MEQTRGLCITLSLGGYSQFLPHPTWRIISVNKRFITMDSKCPQNGVAKPLPNGHEHGVFSWGLQQLLTRPGMILQALHGLGPQGSCRRMIPPSNDGCTRSYGGMVLLNWCVFPGVIPTNTNYRILGMLYETNILGSVYIQNTWIYIGYCTYVFCLAHQLLYVVKKTW